MLSLLTAFKFRKVLGPSLALICGASTLGASPKPSITLEAVHVVPMMSGSWMLTLDAAGKVIVLYAGKEHVFRIAPSRLREIERQIKSEDFFGLQENYGTFEIEAELRQMIVRSADREKRVSLGSSIPDEQLSEARRALRLWISIRSLFKLPGAADSRPADLKLVERGNRQWESETLLRRQIWEASLRFGCKVGNRAASMSVWRVLRACG